MKALVVDDSALMRRQIGDILTRGGFDVASARTGAEAIERLPIEKPDVVTLDINMPEMDGLTCLSRIMTEHPTPVVMISSLTEDGALATLEAIALGAVDFMQKPGGTVSANLRSCEEIILEKVTAAARARPRRTANLRQRLLARRETILGQPLRRRQPSTSVEALTLVGASTGGPAVLEELLSCLSADYPMPVLVCQHMPSSVTRHFAERLNRICPMPVVELRKQTELEAGTIYVARGDADMIVMIRNDKLVATIVPPSRNYSWHPSVNRLVESAMKCVTADSLIGVLMTGMGDDGAAEMTALRKAGGYTMAESEESCVVYGMPRALIEAGGACDVLDASDMAAKLERVAFTRSRIDDKIRSN
ncbi:chemotaxis-specific protein-glutamate methyltransferase CheB [Novosphingobium sp. FSY-8]|uniref:Protein-glutamate methylesterase/protein-glutamine glutaminase n=1 Tax=Novosphingobium ovatum TaxID=1908523 RepID=A0ABW9XG00_9SPHN|nr:chemotaxis-specific protein-glutamate methyltransferase CheB [Novosphingobium ovatum]NBC37414.1 chemotaxis-specific protein-glutamate methyltransferase CheB [Novosphingobium ovatum]